MVDQRVEAATPAAGLIWVLLGMQTPYAGLLSAAFLFPTLTLTCGCWRGAVRAQRQAKLQAALEELMTLVVRTINEKKDHIPPVVSSAVLTFSFDISIAGCAVPAWLEAGMATRAPCVLCTAAASLGAHMFVSIAAALCSPVQPTSSCQATYVCPITAGTATPACQQAWLKVQALGGARAGSRGYGLENLKRLLMHTSPPPVLS